ncbi:hypothetical protein WICPIJ_002582 [Wickerhamomyces pijperi]|uniref:BHLH domain-containing protein n=1 Tax=Wickerhamomyces pijperi TaxID=599730 RepID=A0A9P8TNS5_WICPI|nr:hypothetical protein WICPIJ_002582 [Wickerhamomyces pijperi]
MSTANMGYTFDDYDAFLASLTNNPQNQHPNGMNQLNPAINTNSQVKMEQKSSFSSGSVLSEEENPYYNQNNIGHTQGAWNQQQFLSPDFTSNSNSNESSPHEIFNNDIFDFSNPLGLSVTNNTVATNQNNTYMNRDFLKLEKTTSLPLGYDSLQSQNAPAHVNNQQTLKKQHVKLADAVPNSCHVTKSGKVKKEKSSHNMIEKRYRTNINDKINALRDSVPALRILVHEGSEDDYADDNDELDGLQPAKKLNKATILSKATEYIKHLELKNDILKKENDDLKLRLYGETPRSSVDSNASQQHLMANNGGSNYANRILLGGLTCMVGSSLSDDLNNMDSRQLFALPIISFNSQGSMQLNWQFISLFSKISLLFGVILYVLVPLLSPTSVDEKKQKGLIVDNVRDLNGSIFTAPKTNDNDQVAKFLIFKSFQLRLKYGSNEIIQYITTLMWNYCKEIKITNNEKLSKILSKPIELTLNNKKFMNKLKLEHSKADESLSRKLYSFVCETERNIVLKKFLVKSIESQGQANLKDIATDSLELQTLFNPTDENVERYSKILDFQGLLPAEAESCDEEHFSNDNVVLSAAKILNAAQSEDPERIGQCLKELNVNTIILNNEKLNLLGFTSLYLISVKLNQLISKPHQLSDESLIKLEELSSFLRIWISENSKNYQIVNSKKNIDYKFKFIQFFISVNLKINYGLVEESK